MKTLTAFFLLCTFTSFAFAQSNFDGIASYPDQKVLEATFKGLPLVAITGDEQDKLNKPKEDTLISNRANALCKKMDYEAAIEYNLTRSNDSGSYLIEGDNLVRVGRVGEGTAAGDLVRGFTFVGIFAHQQGLFFTNIKCGRSLASNRQPSGINNSDRGAQKDSAMAPIYTYRGVRAMAQ